MNSTYAFRYKHTQSALEYLVKVSRMGSKSLVHALAIKDDNVHGFDIVTGCRGLGIIIHCPCVVHNDVDKALLLFDGLDHLFIG